MTRRRTRWLHRPWVQGAAARLIAGYVRLVHRTGRWDLQCHPVSAELIRARRPFIGAFWHGRMLMIDPAWRAAVAQLGVAAPLQPYVVISNHRDGRLVARAIAHFGLKTVLGSTRHGGASLLRGALRVLECGQIAVVTPDGPRGPRLRAKPGVVQLAIASGAPIVPITFAAANQKLLASWDRFAFPLPFTRGVLRFGAPIALARDTDTEQARAEVERALIALTAEAERAVGHGPEAWAH